MSCISSQKADAGKFEMNGRNRPKETSIKKPPQMKWLFFNYGNVLTVYLFQLGTKYVDCNPDYWIGGSYPGCPTMLVVAAFVREQLPADAVSSLKW